MGGVGGEGGRGPYFISIYLLHYYKVQRQNNTIQDILGLNNNNMFTHLTRIEE